MSRFKSSILQISVITILLLLFSFQYSEASFSDSLKIKEADTLDIEKPEEYKSESIDKDFTIAPAELLSKYISIESITGNEREAGMFLAEICKKMGLHVEIITDDVDTFNFAASLYPLEMNKPNVVFHNHIDVVPADNPEIWTHPPFSGAIVNDTVWGRGSIDNKGMAVMQLMAMQKFIEKAQTTDFPINITMISVSGEEKGGFTGAKIITDRFLDKLNPIVVYGEGGTGLPDVLSGKPERKLFGISTATKRVLWLKLTLDMETSGHGSVPPVSYAVQEMVDALNRVMWMNNNRIVRFSEPARVMLNEIGKIETGILGFALRNERLFRPIIVPVMKRNELLYSLISNTVTVTNITSKPGPPNQIPQTITATLDCRLLPGLTTEEFLNKIRYWLLNDNIQIEIINEREISPPTKIDKYYYKKSDAIKTVYKNAEVIPILSPASNDNNYFRAKGIPTYGILPVFMSINLIESIHNVDERLPINRLEEGVQVYAELIKIFLDDAQKEISKK